MKKLVILLSIFTLMATPAMALTLDYGAMLLLIDGDADNNVSVELANQDLWDGYFLEYSTDGGVTWLHVDGPSHVGDTSYSATTLAGGIIVDFSLRKNEVGAKRYTLSGDLADDTYSIKMVFDGVHAASGSANPVVDYDYFDEVDISWMLSTDVKYSASFAFDGSSLNDPGKNDGFAPAPVPEPGTLLLLGSGLIGLAYLKRRKS